MLLSSLVDAAWTVVLYVVPFFSVLMAIVFVHELGHFLAARWCGIRVDAFSLGFGPELAAVTDRRGTRWRLAAVPLGGYVNFARPDATSSAAVAGEGALRAAPLGQRALVVACGPLANFVFAFVVFAGLAMVVGTRDVAPRIGYVEAGSPAADAGLARGDVVVEMAGGGVLGWSDIERRLAANGDRRLALTVDRAGWRVEVELTPRLVERDTGLGRSARVPSIGIDSDLPAVIGRVSPGQPAAQAGLMPGDRVCAVDDRPIGNFRDLVAVVMASPGRPLGLSVERDGALLKLTATPAVVPRHDADGRQQQPVGRLGVAVAPPPPHRLGPGSALVYGARETGHAIAQTMTVLGALFTSREAAEQVGGPILIAEATAEVVKLGPAMLVMWTAILSVNLGLFNLLPIPILDGGHLMFHALEALVRRPLSPRLEAMGLKLGLALIGTLVVLVNLSDLVRVGRRMLG